MAMEISGSYSPYKTDYAEQLRAAQKERDEHASDKIPVPQDEYISSEKADVKPSGLYRVGQDEEGKKKVFFDDPKKPEAEEKVTGNTDKVDREIEKLKEKKQNLEEQIKKAETSGDEEKVKELEKKLEQVKSELSQKDNEMYRRQHTVFS